MTLKEVALKQPASQEQSGSQNSTTNRPEDRVHGDSPETIVEDRQLVHLDISSLIRDEVLRYKVRTFIEEKPTSSRLQRFLSHQLFLTAIGFLLTGVMGGLLTYYYTLKQKDLDYHRAIQQQELASQRSFSDELNKVRIQKIGEVWEQVDKNEVLLDSLLEQANKSSMSDNQKNQNVDAINNLIREDRVIINKNRFWLDEQNYSRFQNYLDKNVKIALNMLLARPGTDVSEIIEERKYAKQDILQIRESMRSEGQPGK
jgi:hypothetical protein